jgi:hypothetical protein
MSQSAEFQAFDKAVGRIMGMSKEELQRREEAYRQQQALNPRKRGPKPKLKPAS